MPAQDLMLSTETQDDAAVIHVVGELDLSNVAAFDAELQRSQNAARLVVVLTECNFIDSSALQALVRAQRSRQERGRALALVAPSQPARRVLEVAALDRLVPVFDTLLEAVTSAA